MQSLQAICGLPLTYNEENGQLYLDNDVYCEGVKEVKLSELVPTLLNKSLRYPESVYQYHQRVMRRLDFETKKWEDNLRYDIFVLPSGLLGIEYIKTHVYYTDMVANRYACIVEVQYGELTIVMQKNMPKGDLDFDTHVEAASVITAKAGEKLAVPTGYLFTFVNVGLTSVVFTVLRIKEQIYDYRKLNREQGMAYFLIAKNAKAEVVTNPRYRTAPTVYNLGSNEEGVFGVCFPQKPLYNLAVELKESILNLL